MDRYFPWKTTRRKSNDLPWLNRKTIKKIEARKRLYWSEGGKRTRAWKEEKKRTDDLVRERKKGYIETQKSHILAKDANRNFFRHVKTFSRLEKPKLFDVRDLYDNKNDNEVAEDLAEYFVKVSREFDPLEPADVPVTRESTLPSLQRFEVAARLRRFRKPKSMVPGDLFPCLVSEVSDFLAIPLTDIYNEISCSKIWPSCWKKEFVTVIPKIPAPQSLADLRNISCTMLSSKAYESYVLQSQRTSYTSMC